jgi:alpha-D-xyloside xylohydrolase
MLKETLLLFFTPLLLSNLLSTRNGEKNEDIFVKTEDGVIVYPNVSLSGGAKAVRLKVITNNIIRVTSTPTDKFTDKQSLIISYATKPEVKWNMVTNKDKIVLKTASLAATVNISTGAVNFADLLGNDILSEKQ